MRRRSLPGQANQSLDPDRPGRSGRGPRGAGWAAALGMLALAVGAAATVVAPDESLQWLWRWLIVAGTLIGAPTLVLDSSWWQRRQATRERLAEVAARPAHDQRNHFAPRGRGVLPFGGRQGWYFTGRTRALRELAQWLTDSGQPTVQVVTGTPGSGKSAMLGRLVLLADPQHRQTALRADPDVDPVVVDGSGRWGL